MAIELTCQGCGQSLRVPNEHAGKKARCPKCQQVNSVPQSLMAEEPRAQTAGGNFTDPATSQFSSAAEMWQLKLEDGQTYGPVPREELERWFGEGRISPRSQLQSSRLQRWQWAGEVFTSLGIPLPTTSTAIAPSPPNLFADAPVNQTYQAPVNPYAAPQSYGYSNHPQQNWQNPHRGAAVLVLGICGLLVCGLLAPVAVIMGHNDLRDMRTGRMDPDGRGLTIAGVILGWIITVPMILGFIFIFLAILAGAMR